MSDRLNNWRNRGKRAQPNGLHDEMFAKLQRTIRRERSRLRDELAEPVLGDETFDGTPAPPKASPRRHASLSDTPEQLEPLTRKRPSRLYEAFLERMGGDPPDG